MEELYAPGWPGSPGRWTSGSKCGVGTALGAGGIWFTLSHGILNEVYAPRIDQAAIRDMGLVVTAGGGYFSEEKRHAVHQTECVVPGVPAYRLRNTCAQGRYRIEKEVITDPDRPVVLVRVRFAALQGSVAEYRLFVLLAPHLQNHGGGNTGWVGDYKGVPALFAARGADALCLMSSSGFKAGSAGFVGVSDGWQDLRLHGEMAWRFTRAENGNVALTGELDLAGGELVLALGMGRGSAEAGQRCRASLAAGFDHLLEAFVDPWRRWQDGLRKAPARALFATSAMVAKTHQSKHASGAMLASLAVPWGFSMGDGDLGGYHLVWPRDLVESAGGLLAAGAREEARGALAYLEATQEADGHWGQNMWTDGTPYWSGVQMDETALPVLLVDLARREGALDGGAAARYWPMVRKAAAFLVQSGPVTNQDRWEEDGGYTPFTLAAEIAALLAAADLAELSGEARLAPYLRETADAWNAHVESWLYVRDTELAHRVGVEGYYVRIAPPGVEDGDAFVPTKNRPPAEAGRLASAIVSADALALVRFGLRSARDPRIADTVRVIDALLKVETPAGPAWHRYNGDGYGEHADGGPFDGTGIGRLWPLLTGERAHHALALGDRDQAERLLGTMERLAGEGGLLPEQTWDSPDLPRHGLFFGRPAGSAMPLVWAHAEYLKLVRSIADGRVFDMPPQTVRRYLQEGTTSRICPWRFNHKVRQVSPGSALRIETLAPATVRWSMDGWATPLDARTRDSGFGVHVADLPTERLARGAEVSFTFYWPEARRWEGADFAVKIR